ncbi:MAG: N-6 DNA methylase [Pseudomonadota bacterium]
MRQRHRDIFTTIKTEGNLLPIDLLHRIAEGDSGLKGLTPDSYHLTKNERLNEIINRAWNRCQSVWRVFQSDAASLPEADAGTTLTRERWLLPFFQELEYGRLLTSKAQEIDHKTYPISHAWHHTPIHLVTFRQDLDRRTPGVAGAARMSPHSLVQEFLNRSDDNLWGIVSNGLRLRLLRDNASLTRQAYLEFDLEGMMSGEVYSDFILLFLLLHQSRVEAERPDQCWLESWTQEAQKHGTRALDHLRGGVEQAIATLGQGFLAHPANTDLRQRLQSGDLTTYDLYQQLLRLVYRMIFLFVAEDRNLLLLPDAPAEVRRRYLNHYSITRIRRLAGRLRGTRHADIWQGLRVTFGCLASGEPALGIDPLGGFLFSENAISDLNNCELSNDALLTAVRNLSFTQDNKTLRPVDYRNLGTEELGSVYESLLELHPEINVSASTFDLKVAAGSERKTTGSYYTPSSLINCLLDSALEPVIARALKETDPEKALLDLKVVDPACGSGHFLISAAHRIGKHLAMIRTGEIEPPPEERRKALRDVVSHCIYGVDVNPLAVELCKVALWIETLDPGRPLGFLDHHIKCGNSLIGATPELLEKGIPDDAFKPVEGDDKKIATAIRKKNREERKGQQDLFAEVATESEWQEAAEDFQEWGSMPEHSFHEVCDKAAQYETLQDKPAYRHEKQVADLWTAAFFWPLNGETATTMPTEDIFRRFQGGAFELKEEVQKRSEAFAHKHRFFHWHLEFPEVFSNSSPLSKRGAGGDFDMMTEGEGFDCVLGNPPWERIKLQEKEFFAQKDPEIATAPNAAARKKLIAELPETNPGLWFDFLEAKRTSESESHFIRASDRYPLSAVGDINTYQIFAGLARELISEIGRAGIVIPSGIATDDSNKQFFADLTEKQALVSLYDFENREGIFPAVHRSYKFCLLTMGGEIAVPKGADFAFFLTNIGHMKEENRHFPLSAEDIALLNPNTRTCPIFRSKRDAELTKYLYLRTPILQRDRGNNFWPVRFRRVFDMNHSSVSGKAMRLDDLTADFVGSSESLLPMYEGKMFDMYNHRKAGVIFRERNITRTAQSEEARTFELENPSFNCQPLYYYPSEEVISELMKFTRRKWLLAYKNVCSPTNERTMIAAVIPFSATNFSIRLAFLDNHSPLDCCRFLANLCSFPFDYILRQSIGGVNLSDYITRQIPTIIDYTALTEFLDITPRVLELTYTAYDLEPFAKDCAYFGPPFCWDEERRFFIRCELDAAFFNLYGINRDDVDYIMETFPIVKRKDEQKYGEYRTKRVILECYDAMTEAMKTGRLYQTILDPPPADPRVAHPSSRLTN